MKEKKNYQAIMICNYICRKKESFCAEINVEIMRINVLYFYLKYFFWEQLQCFTF